jgi:hypothetical protein
MNAPRLLCKTPDQKPNLPASSLSPSLCQATAARTIFLSFFTETGTFFIEIGTLYTISGTFCTIVGTFYTIFRTANTLTVANKAMRQKTRQNGNFFRRQTYIRHFYFITSVTLAGDRFRLFCPAAMLTGESQIAYPSGVFVMPNR